MSLFPGSAQRYCSRLCGPGVWLRRCVIFFSLAGFVMMLHAHSALEPGDFLCYLIYNGVDISYDLGDLVDCGRRLLARGLQNRSTPLPCSASAGRLR